jgi:hypothetical protein
MIAASLSFAATEYCNGRNILDIATKDRDVAGNTCVLAEEYDVGLWIVPDVVLM